MSPYISKQKKSIKLYLKSNKRKDITMVFERDVFFWLQAKPYLEKAMKLDPSFLEAVYIMVEILGQEQQYDKGIEM